VFSLDEADALGAAAAMELPDSFFDVTMSDMEALVRDAKNKALVLSSPILGGFFFLNCPVPGSTSASF
jgi:hypothetical protein